MIYFLHGISLSGVIYGRKIICQSVWTLQHNWMKCSTSTIYALSTPPGRAAVAVIRVSGPQVIMVLKRLARFKKIPEPRKLFLKKIFDPVNNKILDQSLVVWFPKPKSFTGEDCCELHVHSGTAVITSVLQALGKLPKTRPAEPGEFTKRAFLNDKLDLTEVEGMADLLNAETEAQQQQALSQMEGCLYNLYSGWKDRLKTCLAHVEAFIDFSEDENIEDGIMDVTLKSVQSIFNEIQNHLADNRRGERLRSGVKVVIVGEPNVGKSSLLNLICQREVAIVSPRSGTTRDVIEAALNIGGYPVLFCDTAGFQETEDLVEQEGVKRAFHRLQQADLIIHVKHCLELIEQRNIGELVNNIYKPAFLSAFDTGNVDSQNNLRSEHAEPLKNSEVIVAINKSDLLPEEIIKENLKEKLDKECVISCCLISCKTGYGLNAFLSLLQNKIKNLCGDSGTFKSSLTRDRHRFHLIKCQKYLKDYVSEEETDIAIKAEKLRKGLIELGMITGHVCTEEVLDVIFKDFCIGK
ncbi:5-taurinomethyluridine-[tRNA] synthase subunit GTPB3, mitochondrial [Tachypleus tridentatus]|uniref:5-taurinomethyluridine-[tRNA] synthase subunit GTPB3, mitochondrial n=1 Tax=Tachypleus tridentatus TaxID=6853 RepID=UPI003FCFF7C9